MPESKISIFIGNLFFVSFIVICLFGIWWHYMYNVGMSIDYLIAIPTVIFVISFITLVLSWISWKITKGSSPRMKKATISEHSGT